VRPTSHLAPDVATLGSGAGIPGSLEKRSKRGLLEGPDSRLGAHPHAPPAQRAREERRGQTLGSDARAIPARQGGGRRATAATETQAPARASQTLKRKRAPSAPVFFPRFRSVTPPACGCVPLKIPPAPQEVCIAALPPP
jgi:hypothetical protein